MQIGFVGLGRMGLNMVKRLLRDGHDVVAWNREPAKVDEVVAEGATGAASFADLAAKLNAPRAIWVMLPAGAVTEQVLMELAAFVEAGDTLIDGGNSQYQDDVRRAKTLRKKGVHYIDAGTSGGVWGLERGYCLMIGGPNEAVQRLDPIFATLAPGQGDVVPAAGREARNSTAEHGYLHCGPAGAGHFVKMVHNGIEYGMMQAYAEGFDLLRHADRLAEEGDEPFDFDLADISELWRRGSVVGSWLLDLTATALAEDEKLAEFSGHVSDSGEGRWTVQAAVDAAVPAHVLTASLYARFRSRVEGGGYADKLLSAMRKQFGGHQEPK